ncbi:hypothetical protein GF323_02965 [Candidatus Woesearchaeota archaeon]|nr:hypothetical protein [Candidatus Woesearchaeota archaeon]
MGVAYFVLPYLDKKIEALENMYCLLRDNSVGKSGEIFIPQYFSNQIKILPKRLKSRHSLENPGNLYNADLFEFIGGSPCSFRVFGDLIYMKHGNLIINKPKFVRSLQEFTIWGKNGPKGERAGQRISLYKPAA